VNVAGVGGYVCYVDLCSLLLAASSISNPVWHANGVYSEVLYVNHGWLYVDVVRSVPLALVRLLCKIWYSKDQPVLAQNYDNSVNKYHPFR
jgi:hypothetical protein